VRYTAKRSREEASAEKSQKLEAWAKWTPDAKVLERGDDVVTCTPTIFAGGPCSACGKQMGKAAHMIPEVHKVSRQDAWGSIEAGFYCAACCPAAKHGKTKPKKKAAE
jgi:hypothetical protein